MLEWFETLADRYWLLPDTEGEEEARFIKRALRLRKGQAVLDAPCGAARICFHLSLAGCSVTGVDLRQQFLNRARRRYHAAGLKGRFLVSDIRSIEFENEFDCVFNWGGSFGYFTDDENLEILRLCACALKPGGRLLLDQVNRERILRDFLYERRNGSFVFRNSWDNIGKRIISHRIVRGRDNPKNVSSMRAYTRRETERMFEKAGLEVERFYGWITGEPYARSSRRMIAVANKPK
jgi:SAM-dependent methyltransferase